MIKISKYAVDFLLDPDKDQLEQMKIACNQANLLYNNCYEYADKTRTYKTDNEGDYLKSISAELIYLKKDCDNEKSDFPYSMLSVYSTRKIIREFLSDCKKCPFTINSRHDTYCEVPVYLDLTKDLNKNYVLLPFISGNIPILHNEDYCDIGIYGAGRYILDFDRKNPKLRMFKK